MKICRSFCLFFLLTLTHFSQCQVLNYSHTKLWLALPEKSDYADAVPVYGNKKDEQATAQADVFYIHPTTYYAGASKNDKFRKPSTKRIAKSVLLCQASTFNGCFKIYAPRYRQASLQVVRKNTNESFKALDFAYEDIKNSFDYYLKNHNKGRPFVIASHSQGSYHAMRLIYDFMERDSLSNQLIAAYIGGYPVLKLQMDSMYSTIKYCDSALQTGCLLNWQTLGKNGYYESMIDKTNIYYKGEPIAAIGERLCINPTSWNRDTIMVDKSMHLGSAKMATRKRELKIVMVNYLDTKVENGFVYIDKPKGKLFNATGKNYHIYDYNLFYLNIGVNACERLNAWLVLH
jgi:hypothetical protein